MDEQLEATLREVAQGDGGVVVLTGAGISAESGIPTFRGREGYWTIGAKEYHPQEMATHAMFSRRPKDVWQWYLYRRGVCRNAEPNQGHLALARLERALGDRFLLITQNVDGLHLRAGNTLARTYQIHGNVDYMRCAGACRLDPFPIPEEVPAKAKGEALTEADEARLKCPECGGWGRPHILWFDECYDEGYYRFNSSQRAAAESELLLVVGTSGATNLPLQVGALAAQAGAAVVDINPEPNPFSMLAERLPRGHAVRGGAGQALTRIVELLAGPAS